MFKANDLDDCIEHFRVDLALVYQMAWFRDRNWSLSDLLMLKFPALDGQDINLPTYIYIFYQFIVNDIRRGMEINSAPWFIQPLASSHIQLVHWGWDVWLVLSDVR